MKEKLPLKELKVASFCTLLEKKTKKANIRGGEEITPCCLGCTESKTAC